MRHGMQHLALIMDGNRRWARNKEMASLGGLEGGSQSFEAAIECCLRRKIPYLTVFALSLENLSRADGTLASLYALLNNKGEELIQKLSEQNVEMRFVGERSLFDPSVAQIIDRIESSTRGNTALRVTALFCYGAQQEIVHAAQQVARDVAAGLLRPEDITIQTFENSLWTAGLPAPDLIIRTGGFVRLSNFLLYQAAYAEFKFLDVLWPDLTSDVLDAVLDEFVGVRRNFGM
jgi:undecaprenyl diphosphate synthase